MQREITVLWGEKKVVLRQTLWAWQLARVPKRAGGYSLDLDSRVFERYGEQEGVKRRYNPRNHGRASHHPLLVVWGENDAFAAVLQLQGQAQQQGYDHPNHYVFPACENGNVDPFRHQKT